MTPILGKKIHVTGIVQGVGFRPFVYTMASHLNLKGWVRNSSAGVDIQIEGKPDSLVEFCQALENDFPPLAKIDSIQVEECSLAGFSAFEIIPSELIPGAYIPISPDVSICPDCLQEMLDPSDLRYLYPFINCTNCGPRFTIIQDIPYDRPKTTMAPFEMCEDCRVEYKDPLNRRFHAQPVACPVCGPHIWLEESKQFTGGSLPFFTTKNNQLKHPDDMAVIREVQTLLAKGKILAMKGLGGFHLACDATDSNAVVELRNRKLRVDKPFAIMVKDIGTIERHCYLSELEKELLLSRERPIVLLHRKSESTIDLAVAPQQNTLGVMLPYTPLHHMLFQELPHLRPDQTNATDNFICPPVLVMTSGNISEEPIAFENQDARERLAPLADVFLMHDRNIHTRCDDSVIRLHPETSRRCNTNKTRPSISIPLRRSRGYAPDPIRLPWHGPQILAAGSELKNTFCLTKENNAFLSHHIGDMENFETLDSFENGIAHFETLFRISPQAIACDLHPDYLATRYAQERAQMIGIPHYQVQHHHAHIASCMVDNGLTGDQPILGVSLDGTGYGDDGAIWGGEFLISDYCGYQRFAHLEYTPLPGGDSATRKPFRIALAQLWHHKMTWDGDLPPVRFACGDEQTLLRSMLENNINSPLTSSMGRLFDAVAALVGVRAEVNYEAQAAVEFETLAAPDVSGRYSFLIGKPSSKSGGQNPVLDPLTLATKDVFAEIIQDLNNQVPVQIISAKFHNGLTNAILDVCQAANDKYGINQVALSGGVWQNMTLLSKTIRLLEQSAFKVYTHQQVPPNDGGISLGQAAIVSRQFYQA